MKLSLDFYTLDDVLKISRSLLGKTLMSNTYGGVTGGMIVEVEAYRGATDRASHAYPNNSGLNTYKLYR